MFSVDYFSSAVNKGADPLRDYTNTFVLSSSATAPLKHLQGLNVDPERQRRSHKKSRTGCESCKRRRVKCNEETPCANCLHRGESCRRVQREPGKSQASRSALSVQSGVSRPKQVDSPLNLGHLQLFHHFQTQTIETLMISPQAWEFALQLSFQFDFLMNTILCVAVRHLSILQPMESNHTTVAANYLCRALSGLRHQIAHNFHTTHIDAFIATSLLLQIEVWANADYLSVQNNVNSLFEPAQDRLFVFCSSLKRVFLQNVPQILNQDSVFRRHLVHNPTDTLVKFARIDSASLAQYQDFFAYNGPLQISSLNPPLPSTRGDDLAVSCPWHQATNHAIRDVPDPVHDGYIPTITRLCLILSYLPEAEPPISATENPVLFREMARYITNFPVSCYGPFASMVQQSDPHAILLLYHFYRATNQLLPRNQYWWVRERASAMERVLRDWLNNRVH